MVPGEWNGEWCYNDCDMMQRRAEHCLSNVIKCAEQNAALQKLQNEAWKKTGKTEKTEKTGEHATRSEVNK